MQRIVGIKQLALRLPVAVVLIVAAFFMVNVPLPPWSHWLSGVNVVLFAIPAFWVTRRWLGWRDAIGLWIVLGVYALLIETSAIYTGFPYGHFGYSDLLGAKLLGMTPWTVFLAWTPIILGAYSISAGLGQTAISRIILTALLATAVDLTLDPGAVRVGFWRYSGEAWWYSVPWSNFAGWLVSSSLAAGVIEIFLSIKKPLLPTPVRLVWSLVPILGVWTFVCHFAGLYLASIAGAVTLLLMLIVYVRKVYQFDEMLVLCDEAGRPTGTVPKGICHDSSTPLHLAFSIFLFNSKGELLLQQRAFSKKTWPGVWSNSCCGHQMLHEAVIDGARRRLKYELGLRCELHEILPDYRYRAEKDGVVENEICPVFVGFTDDTPRLEKSEVAAVRCVRWSDVNSPAGGAALQLSPWAVEEAALLEDDAEFKRLFAENTRPAW